VSQVKGITETEGISEQYAKENILTSRSTRYSRHSTLEGQERNSHSISAEKLEGKRPFVGPGSGRKIHLKRNLNRLVSGC
jgi:hypothetical protein